MTRKNKISNSERIWFILDDHLQEELMSYMYCVQKRAPELNMLKSPQAHRLRGDLSKLSTTALFWTASWSQYTSTRIRHHRLLYTILVIYRLFRQLSSWIKKPDKVKYGKYCQNLQQLLLWDFIWIRQLLDLIYPWWVRWILSLLAVIVSVSIVDLLVVPEAIFSPQMFWGRQQPNKPSLRGHGWSVSCCLA